VDLQVSEVSDSGFTGTKWIYMYQSFWKVSEVSESGLTVFRGF